MIPSLAARARSLWRGLRRRGEIEAEMAEEFRHHLELRAEDLVRQGVAPPEAARRARLEFGHLEGHREDARASRGLRLVDEIGFSWLDLKLGVRMLAKYPGLSVVSVLGMAVAIAIGGGGFGVIHSIVDAPLPLDEGERVVSIENSDARRPGSPDRRTLHDFLVWRDELRAVRDLSAFRNERRNLVVPGGSAANVRIARMTASGFRVARVAPVLGRPLLDEDERAGAPPVLVIAHEEWQRRFAGDPQVIGRAVRLDGTAHTVVGVMPEGFHFPVDHCYWVPLRLDPAAHAVGAGPELQMFGRLTSGATLRRAQAELTTIGRRMAAAHPETHAHLRPWVRPYTHPFVGIDSPAWAWLLRAIQVGFSLLLVVVSVNVASLVYARTAARTGEIAVRTALGASRRRIVAQLFAEALVMSATAAVLGMAIAALGFGILRDLLSAEEETPFWVNLSPSPALVAYVAGLAVLAAAIVGVVPALRATGRSLQGSLQRLSSQGAGLRLGGTWTALIVFQVAIAVAVLPYAMYSSGRLLRSGAVAPDYPADEIVRVQMALDSTEAGARRDSAGRGAAVAARFVGSVSDVLRRLAAEPDVAGVTFASAFPGEGWYRRYEVEGTRTGRAASTIEVDVGLFPVFDVPILAGRGFVPSDTARGANAVIVDRTYAEQVFGRGPVVGRRVRQWAPKEDGSGEWVPGPWLEIVGVVPAFTPPAPFEKRVAPMLYRPLALADAPARIYLAVRMRRGAAPAAFAGRVREIAHAVDPALRLFAQSAAEADRVLRKGLLSLALAVGAVTGSVLLLCVAGIYAMLSFTVATRRREIGIRSALGATPRRVLGVIFARVSAQLGAGVLAGLVLAIAAAPLARAAGAEAMFTGEGLLLLPVVATVMAAIGLLAALGPARRALRVEPSEALRADT